MIRKAFRMAVHPDQHDEYARRHQPIWRELGDVLTAHGVSNYSIFLDEGTSTLFAYVEIEDEARWAAIAGTDVCRRWWRYMTDVLVCESAESQKAKEDMLREIFHLD